MIIQGGVTYNQTMLDKIKNNISTKDVGKAINNVVKSALFMEALRNLNWSRGYNWYVELDGVPSPFQRGGVIGLPVTDVNIILANGKSYTWSAGIHELSVPSAIGEVFKIQLNLLDDEQGTINTFFERWYNMIYDSRTGVLPLEEAVKQITITKTKSTRATAHRYINNDKGSEEKRQGREFLVYPEGHLLEDEKIDSGPRKYQISLVVAKYLDADYGSPSKKLGQKSIFGIDIGSISTEEGFLSKVADYI